MERQYLCVSNTSAHLDPEAITTALGRLHKLNGKGSNGVFSRVNPLHDGEPITFEFVVTSEGAGRPVEFSYGADDQLDVLHQRLRSMYPASFDIDHVEVDLVEKLLPQQGNRRGRDEVTGSPSPRIDSQIPSPISGHAITVWANTDGVSPGRRQDLNVPLRDERLTIITLRHTGTPYRER